MGVSTPGLPAAGKGENTEEPTDFSRKVTEALKAISLETKSVGLVVCLLAKEKHFQGLVLRFLLCCSGTWTEAGPPNT